MASNELLHGEEKARFAPLPNTIHSVWKKKEFAQQWKEYIMYLVVISYYGMINMV
jgi:hypothetical protein